MRLLSPAKINLFLHVLGKRSDGYHELYTLFERIDLADTVRLSATPGEITLKVSGHKVDAGPSNLAWRAADLLKRRYKVRKGVAISLTKRIPVAAGLGGGSSNAATVLLGLNRLWKLGLPTRQLMRLGAELGSDVPFFLLETPFALGRGRGEKLKKVPVKGPKIWHVLVKPDFGISTKEAYGAFSATRTSADGELRRRLTPPRTDVKMLVHSIQNRNPEPVKRLLINSLEVSLNKRVTTISKIKKNLLETGALGALMSGSGSAVFGVFSSREKAMSAAKILRKKNRTRKVFVTSTY